MPVDLARAPGQLPLKKRPSEISTQKRPPSSLTSNNPKSPGGLKKTPTQNTAKSMGAEKRERAKRPPKTPQTVEVYYRIFNPTVSPKEGEPAELEDNEERKGPKEELEE